MRQNKRQIALGLLGLLFLVGGLWAASEGSQTLYWDASPSSDVSFYLVEKAIEAPGVPLAFDPATTTTALSWVVPESVIPKTGRLLLRVKAVDGAGNVSEATPVVAVPTTADRIPPTKPGNIKTVTILLQ